MTGARIRTARVEDLDALLGLWAELADGRPEARPGDAPQSRAVLERMLGDERRHLLVAELDPAVVVGTL